MEFNILEKLEFIPEWRGNSKSDSPAVFVIQPLNRQQLDRAQSSSIQQGKIKIDIDYKFIFLEGVISVKNLKVNNRINLQPEDWVDVRGIGGIIEEVAVKILEISRVEEEDKKK